MQRCCWLGQQTCCLSRSRLQHRAPCPAAPLRAADCKCTGGPPSSQVLQRAALPYYSAPCRTGTREVGTQPLCQPFTWTGRQALSGCLLEAVNATNQMCYFEMEKGGRALEGMPANSRCILARTEAAERAVRCMPLLLGICRR